MITRSTPARIGVRVAPFVTPDGIALAIEIGARDETPPGGRSVSVRPDQLARAAELLARREIRSWAR